MDFGRWLAIPLAATRLQACCMVWPRGAVGFGKYATGPETMLELMKK
jgi:hypothetical protein